MSTANWKAWLGVEADSGKLDDFLRLHPFAFSLPLEAKKMGSKWLEGKVELGKGMLKRWEIGVTKR